MNGSEGDKLVIGLYGEMRLAMELHKRGWQVYRAYIDEKFDFVILKSYCESCQSFKNALTREEFYKGRNRKAVTPLCETCEQDSLKMLVRFIQVKTSEGVPPKQTKLAEEIKEFSFHPKSVIIWQIPEYFMCGYKSGTKIHTTSTTTFLKLRMLTVLTIWNWIPIK